MGLGVAVGSGEFLRWVCWLLAGDARWHEIFAGGVYDCAGGADGEIWLGYCDAWIGSLKVSEQKQFEAIRQMVRDWVNQNRVASAEQGGEIEEREGVDWDGAAFYMVDGIMPHGVARIMVTMPAFHPFRFINMEALSVATEGGFVSLARWRLRGNLSAM